MRRAVFALFIPALAASACTQAPFVDREISSAMDKPVSPVLKDGTAIVCYASDAAWADVEAQAQAACGDFGYLARLTKTERWQCRLSAPHKAEFSCYHPDMINPEGRFINPSDSAAVKEWQKRTGKMLPKRREALTDMSVAPGSALPAMPAQHVDDSAMPAQHVGDSAMPARHVGDSAMPAKPAADIGAESSSPTQGTLLQPIPAIAETPPPAYRPLTPADIAGKADMAPAPLLAEPPPVVQPYPATGNFNLPAGSWGQAFEE